MDLKEFVSITIKQVIDGVVEAQESTKETTALINPIGTHIFKTTYNEPMECSFVIPNCTISFDVVVSISESEEAKGGVGLVVGVVGLGGQAKSETGYSAVNRIKFEVPLVLPFQENKRPEINIERPPPEPMPNISIY